MRPTGPAPRMCTRSTEGRRSDVVRPLGEGIALLQLLRRRGPRPWAGWRGMNREAPACAGVVDGLLALEEAESARIEFLYIAAAALSHVHRDAHRRRRRGPAPALPLSQPAAAGQVVAAAP